MAAESGNNIRSRAIVMPLGQRLPTSPEIEWFAAFGTIVAAALVAADLGRRWTGIGFVVFVVVSVAWILSGTINGTMPLVAQNGILLLINAWGVWQFLINPRKKREIERVEQIEQQVKQEAS
jgi:4-amino-4-deoxy-L-arabinose transferase-like glycosyltransferase